ncbi:WcbI family polysaccharide biosynthesis putative acetyltransferase [Salipiger sp.]|uniref:WcbI family polysaccharide biosynthesis putative acetyltransferase n=1 Tax=Salipiger sp. TaxID=2078585 RepID=UPI003A96D838
MTAPASVAVIANCQSVGLGQALRLMIPGAAVRIVRVHLTNDETRPRVLENLGRSDLILTQDTRTFGELNAASLKQHFPDKTLVVPNVYYRGFHPDACYVGPLGDRVISPVGDYNSVVVLDSFLKGLTPAQCLERFSPEGFADLGLDRGHALSMEEMTRRDNRLDFAGKPIIERFLERKSVFMYTINHPRAAVLAAIAGAALDLAGVRHDSYDPDFVFDNLMGGPLLAIQPFLSDVLGYEVAFPRWRASGEDQRYLANAEFIAASYRIYSETDRDKLVVQSPPALKSVA